MGGCEDLWAITAVVVGLSLGCNLAWHSFSHCDDRRLFATFYVF